MMAHDSPRIFRSCLLAIVGFVLVSPALAAQDDKRPNVVFIFSDDHAAHSISAYGSKINRTPNIDRIAKEGLLLKNCFCGNSICAPSRATILTGQHSHVHGVIDNRERFEGSQRTFPKLLQKAGYNTALFGKWHLKTAPEGFDQFEVLRGQGPYYNPTMRTPNGPKKHRGYTTEIITELALDWLQQDRSDSKKPFFLMVQHKAPHRNWMPGPKELALYEDKPIPEPSTLFDDGSTRSKAFHLQEMTIDRHLTPHDLKLAPQNGLKGEQLRQWDAAYGPRNKAFEAGKLSGQDLVRWKYQRYIKDYLRCIEGIDRSTGKILDALDELGLSENTIVIYTSDQGFYLGDHGWYDKRWMYEPSLRMPFVIRWPGKIKAGTEREALTQNIDFAPTFLDIAGLTPPEDMQGKSMLPVFETATLGFRDAIYYRYWEIGVHAVEPHRGVRTMRHKLMHFDRTNEWEMYDLVADPDEVTNVAEDPRYLALRGQLEKKLEELQVHYGDTDSRHEIRRRNMVRKAKMVKSEIAWSAEGLSDTPPKELDPSQKPLSITATCTPTADDGILFAHGGERCGYALALRGGFPMFVVRDGGRSIEASGTMPLPLHKLVTLSGRIDIHGRAQLWVNGELWASTDCGFLSRKPHDAATLGKDLASQVVPGSALPPFSGGLQNLSLRWGAFPR